MNFIVGLITVFGCVIGGYVMHHGKLAVLWQPTELIIIGGAAIGSFIIGNPMSVIKSTGHSLTLLLKSSPFKKADYIELLVMLYTIFRMIRSKGMLEIEGHIENPHESELFKKYPKFLHNHHAVHFVCDYLRVMTMGMEDYYQLDDQMTRDLEAMHAEEHKAPDAITNVSEAMPALGIVAAVLGVIVTMGSITEPPEILGGLIGAALVGTFLGVLLSYGIIAPMGRYVSAYYAEEGYYMSILKTAILAHVKGNAPVVSVEFARNSIVPMYRPTFQELETAINESSGS